jgi:anti-sigma factor RsiW
MTPSTTSDDNSLLLVHAYLDGELDPANALEIAQRMSTDPALAAEGERVKALQRLIHERLPREVSPSGLRARIETSVGGHRRVPERPSWRACRIDRAHCRGRQQLDLVHHRLRTGEHGS